MTKTCSVPGCSAGPASRYTPLCANHKARLRRHGAVTQRGITARDLAPSLKRVRARIAKNPDSPVWGQLEERWRAVAGHARDIIARFASGRAGAVYERRAAIEVVKIAEATEPREVVEVVLAMFVMLELEPRRFADDRGFRFQLVRRVRALADGSAGQFYDHTSGKVRRVYRELTPRAVMVIGQWLAVAMGGAGVHVAGLERRDLEARDVERRALHAGLEALK